MSRRKQQSYEEMARSIERMQAEMEKEKERMAGVMVKAFMSNQVAAKLGGCTDGELKKIMSMLAGHVDECLAALEAEKQARSAKQEQASPV